VYDVGTMTGKETRPLPDEHEMPTPKIIPLELHAAEDRMNKAIGALRSYISRPRELQNDNELHRRLAEELRLATSEYTRLVFAYTTSRDSQHSP
jgi:hypothetical protein